MIRHVVFFTAKDPANRDAVRDGLEMLKDIPHKITLEIGVNMATDPISGPSPDVIVYGEFADEDQMAAYKADPIYQACIDLVRPMREMRIAADFTAS